MGRYVAKRPLDVGSGSPDSDEVTHYEPGDEVEGADGFANLAGLVEAGYLEPSSGTAGPVVDPDSEYAELTVDELKEKLADRDLPVSGKKAELIARLEESDAG